MKKLIALLIAAALIIIPLSLRSANVKAKESSAEYITAEQIDALTQKICLAAPNRTSFYEACLDAAMIIAGQKEVPGISEAPPEQPPISQLAAEKEAAFLDPELLDIKITEFTEKGYVSEGFFGGYTEVTLTSYNIVAKPKAFDSDKKTVLITTNFANHYEDKDSTGKQIQAEGALNNAASTALTIALANYLSAPEQVEKNEYNFVFAFFSGTDEGNLGSAYFASVYPMQDVMLVINLERLGCGDTYFYTDEAETEHGKFIKDFSKDYNVKEFPAAGRVLLYESTVDELDYTHYAMRGDISTFLSNGYSCLELIGGKFSGLLLGDNEGGSDYLTNTAKDVYDNLISVYPDYADKLADVASFVIELTASSELSDVCLGAATSYKVFAKSWIAYVICFGIIMILILALILVLSKLEKKYPIPAQPKVKIAVFGKEFEDFNENEIIVDIKRTEKDDEIDPFDV